MWLLIRKLARLLSNAQLKRFFRLTLVVYFVYPWILEVPLA